MKLNASAAYFLLHTVSPFQGLTRQLCWLKLSARKTNETSHLVYIGKAGWRREMR
jgi:hypothetical protein